MFDVEIARKFIERLTTYTSYNVNIMNERGIIIASRNPERVGTFHEIAYDIITQNKPMIEVTTADEFLGVQPGVNLLLLHEGKGVGVIGVTGNPAEVKSIAMIIKMSMESMLEYEHEKELSSRRRNQKEQFAYQLIYENNPDIQSLRLLAQKLSYDEDTLRIPILIQPESGKDTETLLQSIKAGPRHTSQDISFVTRDRQILIFKTLPNQPDIFSDYKYIIGEYLNEYLKTSVQAEENCHCYIGSVQNQFSYYRDAYEHCKWLEKNIVSDSVGIFFYDYVDSYLKSLIPEIELHKIFGSLEKVLDDKYKDSFRRLMKVLKKNNYNMVTSSRDLYMHKNTLVFQFNKIRDRLNMNPLQNASDRDFMEYLYYYLNKR